MSDMDRINEAFDRTIATNEAYRLGLEQKPEDCIEMRALLDAVDESYRHTVRWWYDVGVWEARRKSHAAA